MLTLGMIRDSILAGLLVAIGGCVYLAAPDSVTGAFFFSVALLFICYRGYLLYTGRIGFLLFFHGKKDLLAIGIALAGNLLTAYLVGRLCAGVFPALSERAALLCQQKILSQQLWQTLIRAALCGVLMYLSVVLFKERKTPIGILFAIPVFILSGFEHSIADCFYLGIGKNFTKNGALFLLFAILGNTLGALLVAALEGKRREPAKPENK